MRNRLFSIAAIACFLCASLATADVTLTQHKAARTDRAERKAARKAAKAARTPKDSVKAAKRKARRERVNGTQGAGSLVLTDNSGLQWFIDTNITTSSSSTMSAAASEASYTTSVTATTSGGGTTDSTLDDAYDGGYNGMCVSLNNGTGPCTAGGGGGALTKVRERARPVSPSGSPGYILYNNTGGPPVPDGACGNRQYVFPIKLAGGVQMQRKVFVPSSDSFARWLNYFTNTTGAPITFNIIIDGDNLGSDGSTQIVTSSNGNAIAEVSDQWVTSMESYSGSTSSDVRLGHVFQGPGAPVALAGITFVDGNDAPFWYYTMTLAPGQTRIIMNFGVGQPTNAASAAKSAQLAGLASATALSCMSAIEMSQVANFNAQAVVVPTLGPAALALLGLALALVGFVVVRRLI